jgi:hypothetical protein
LCNLLHSPVTSSLLGPNILLRTLVSNTLVYSLPLMWQTKFHTHTKQVAELWFLYILTFTFLDNGWDDKRLWSGW